ncbi:hypothetical protein [Sulfurimonas autotrophica]|uniref:Alginate export domain-containing protein n=1 Tax=Sulfurimonas autotrophica (strain ATCC BAA-671 / DSM 16294 / JCM 11897 / OK10) TaxID=563040 RepID=E0UT49_SULAO|nr:hypothetical protein [Sulfurimonas autotrophica]ADN09290.1 conserved hypothetical protein [Sulfurimonas autotrophica DSM 16294]
MRKLLLSMAALPLVIGGLSVSASADGINILDNMKLKGEIRPRYENVDDGNTATANANAYTARTKLSVTADLLGVDGLTATIGGISVNNFGSHEYNDGTTSYTDGTKPYSKVVDPQDAMISNAAINYKVGDTLLHAGRGQVNLDNQRFIGTVGWRQLERSYDSVFVANNSIKNLSVLAAWVYGFAGVSGTTTADTNTVLLHAVYNVMPELKVTAYDYMIANTHDTYGLALTGNVKLDMAKLNYRAEYASQNDATMEKGTQTPTTGKADAYYYNLDLGANVNGILAGVNYEFLSGANASGSETAFSTPLATGHKFNGWADMFLGTPSGGLKDFNVRLGYTAKGLGKLLAVYHDFTADTTTGLGTDDLGSEFDAVYTNKIPGVNNLTGLLKYADYSKGTATGYTNDVQKIWVGLDYKFALK